MKKLFIDFDKANLIFKNLLKKQEINISKKYLLFKKKPHLIFSNIFDRYPFSTSIISLDTLFKIGRTSSDIELSLYKSLDNSHKFVFYLGKLSKGVITINISFVLSLVISIILWFIKLLASFVDFIIIIFFCFYYISTGKNKSKLKKKKK